MSSESRIETLNSLGRAALLRRPSHWAEQQLGPTMDRRRFVGTEVGAPGALTNAAFSGPNDWKL